MSTTTRKHRREELLARCPLLRAIGHTPLVPLVLPGEEVGEARLSVKLEMLNPGGSVKDRPVARMLVEAVLDGELTPQRAILDSTSGNAGIAYAMVGSALGYRVELVIPDNASQERKERIRAHGAHIVFTDALLGYDEALREVKRRYEASPDRYFFCDQYSNPHNWRAHYEETAAEILEQTEGKITHFVCGVGTGGTLTGVGRRLKEYDSSIQVVCVIPEVFPGIEGLKPLGAPEDIVPEILDESVIDRRIPVPTAEAYRMCRRLARQGFFVGQSSGAFCLAALQVAAEARRGHVVTLFPDLGERYFSANLWAD